MVEELVANVVVADEPTEADVDSVVLLDVSLTVDVATVAASAEGRRELKDAVKRDAAKRSVMLVVLELLRNVFIVS